ncbi:MAG: DNA polymerase III subunit alpha [Deltaproteobacteria bacterium SM23_61]|nr:MAG: DNA polymerase III subunit alpha [Deltaproteobacteria bacterium SM23_61]
MKHAEFVHLHLHTQYSLLDGAMRLDELFEKAKEYRMPALAITDHGTMFGAIEFYQQALKNGIKPIIGCEVYVAPGSRLDKTAKGPSEVSYHLILLAKNLAGYRNLMKLVSTAFFDGFYYKPRVDKELLRQNHEGLIALSACLHGEVPYFLVSGDRRRALQAADELRSIFSDGRFYLELQENKIPEQKKVNEGLMEIARELSLPLVATNDCHYLKREDAQAHEILLCIQTGKTLKDADRMKFSTDEFFFRSAEEMEALFSYCPEAVKNTVEVAERCNLDLKLGELQFPQFQVPPGETLDSFLEKSAHKGLEDRLAELRDLGQSPPLGIEFYRQRLQKEVGMIQKMGFSGYFLIVSDFIRYAKSRGIPVGPGRGSGAGSLVAYCLGITEIDPLVNGLLFERFLNPERVSPPDIDIDFCITGREEVIQYVRNKYGQDYVAQIITFGKMQARAVIRDVGRALNMPYGEVDRIAKMIPNTLNITLEEALQQEPRLKELARSNPEVKKLITLARSLEGLPRHASTHAAGVVISNRPLVEVVPLYRGQGNEIMTQYAMKDVEKIGLIKFDFLGLKTLTMIEDVLKRVEASRGERLDMRRLSLTDRKTYDLLCSGDTSGVFQLESSGMKDLVIRLMPERFEDLVALLALYRPGPLKSGMVDDFIKRKQGKTPIAYEVSELKEILEETYGVIVYQEQVMKIATKLASFNLAQADLLRRAMGKKNAEEMAMQKKNFLEGAQKSRISAKKAEKLFDLMAKFAEYGFNKSHSAAYALVAFQTAYLKAHYPVEFMAALLSSEMGNSDKILRHLGECREKKIEVLPPDVNESHSDFTVVGGKIRFGLAAVKNVGLAAIQSILSAREEKGNFTSLADFCLKVDLRKVNKRVIESLVKCGAFDSLGFSRAPLLAGLEEAMEWAQEVEREKANRQITMFGEFQNGGGKTEPRLPQIPAWPENQRLAAEKETLGFYLTGHPLSSHVHILQRVTSMDTLKVQEAADGKEILIGGVVNSLKETNTKKGDRMAFVTLEDLNGVVEVIVFSDLYKNSSLLLKGEGPIFIKGRVDAGEESVKIIASEVLSFEQAVSKLTTSVHLRLRSEGLRREDLEAIREILQDCRGNCPAVLHLILPGQQEAVIDLGDEWRLNWNDQLVSRVRDLLGYEAVSFQA